MSAISNFLTFLRSAIYAIDVRDGIADAIEQCYNDVNNPTLKTEALEAALQTKIDEGEMAALTIGDHTITAEKLAQGVIDNTLTTSGAAADAKKTGDEIAAVKADLDDVKEVVSEGGSGGFLQMLSMFYDRLITEDSHGPDYYRFMQQTYGLQPKTLKVYVGYGIVQIPNINAYIVGQNPNRMITEPIEIAPDLPTTAKIIGLKNAGLRFGVKYNIGFNVVDPAAPYHFPNDGKTGSDTVFGYTDKTYTMTKANGVDLELGMKNGFGRLPENSQTKSVRIMFADENNMQNNLPVVSFDGTAVINGVPYVLDFTTSAPPLKVIVYNGKSVDGSGDGHQVESPNRAVSDFMPFYGNNMTVSFDKNITNNLRYCVRHYYRLDGNIRTSPVEWNGTSSLWITDNGSYTAKVTLPDGAKSLGYCVIIFADKDSETPITGINGNLIINGESYVIEEAG